MIDSCIQQSDSLFAGALPRSAGAAQQGTVTPAPAWEASPQRAAVSAHDDKIVCRARKAFNSFTQVETEAAQLKAAAAAKDQRRRQRSSHSSCAASTAAAAPTGKQATQVSQAPHHMRGPSYLSASYHSAPVSPSRGAGLAIHGQAPGAPAGYAAAMHPQQAQPITGGKGKRLLRHAEDIHKVRVTSTVRQQQHSKPAPSRRMPAVRHQAHSRDVHAADVRHLLQKYESLESDSSDGESRPGWRLRAQLEAAPLPPPPATEQPKHSHSPQRSIDAARTQGNEQSGMGGRISSGYVEPPPVHRGSRPAAAGAVQARSAGFDLQAVKEEARAARELVLKLKQNKGKNELFNWEAPWRSKVKGSAEVRGGVGGGRGAPEQLPSHNEDSAAERQSFQDMGADFMQRLQAGAADHALTGWSADPEMGLLEVQGQSSRGQIADNPIYHTLHDVNLLVRAAQAEHHRTQAAAEARRGAELTRRCFLGWAHAAALAAQQKAAMRELVAQRFADRSLTLPLFQRWAQAMRVRRRRAAAAAGRSDFRLLRLTWRALKNACASAARDRRRQHAALVLARDMATAAVAQRHSARRLLRHAFHSLTHATAAGASERAVRRQTVTRDAAMQKALHAAETQVATHLAGQQPGAHPAMPWSTHPTAAGKSVKDTNMPAQAAADELELLGVASPPSPVLVSTPAASASPAFAAHHVDIVFDSSRNSSAEQLHTSDLFNVSVDPDSAEELPPPAGGARGGVAPDKRRSMQAPSPVVSPSRSARISAHAFIQRSSPAAPSPARQSLGREAMGGSLTPQNAPLLPPQGATSTAEALQHAMHHMRLEASAHAAVRHRAAVLLRLAWGGLLRNWRLGLARGIKAQRHATRQTALHAVRLWRSAAGASMVLARRVSAAVVARQRAKVLGRCVLAWRHALRAIVQRRYDSALGTFASYTAHETHRGALQRTHQAARYAQQADPRVLHAPLMAAVFRAWKHAARTQAATRNTHDRHAAMYDMARQWMRQGSSGGAQAW